MKGGIDENHLWVTDDAIKHGVGLSSRLVRSKNFMRQKQFFPLLKKSRIDMARLKVNASFGFSIWRYELEDERQLTCVIMLCEC